ncbi:hypothetical protein E6H12_06565 [Candidatus Bathyarchaeota archaeon]|nr:MAG: hypothetical protein E6H12_06565 [Candidatus Bathyarchaeota archaeon]
MTFSAEVVTREIPEIVEFNKLKSRTAEEALAELVCELGIVYVTALTRQGCSGCETQKPLFRTLAERMSQENPEKIRFRSYHVNYQDGDKRESWKSKRIFGHAGYPTYTIHVKSHVGPLEIYRSVYPPMEELEKQIKESFELAEFYKVEAETAARSRTDDL